MVVGKLLSFWVSAYFQRPTVSFREGIKGFSYFCQVTRRFIVCISLPAQRLPCGSRCTLEMLGWLDKSHDMDVVPEPGKPNITARKGHEAKGLASPRQHILRAVGKKIPTCLEISQRGKNQSVFDVFFRSED